MLRAAKRRKVLPSRNSSDRNSLTMINGHPGSGPLAAQPSPSNHSVSPGTIDAALMQHGLGQPPLLSLEGLDPFAAFEVQPGQDIPMWMSESGLVDMPMQHGLEAFLLPAGMDDPRQPVPEIW